MPVIQQTKQILPVVIFTLCLVFAGAVSRVSAQQVSQEYTFKHYTVQDGLAQMQVMSMFTDSRGYLWCMTKAGPSRFDGHRFKNYPNGILPGLDIIVLGETRDSRLLLFSPAKFGEIIGDSIIQYNYPQNIQTVSFATHSQHYNQKEVYTMSANGKEKIPSVMDYSFIDSLKIYPVNPQKGRILLLEEGENNYMWQATADSFYISDVKTGNLIRKIHNPGDIEQIVQGGDQFYAVNNLHQVFLIDQNTFRFLFEIKDPGRFIKIISTPTNDGLVVKTDQNLYYYKDKLVAIKQNLTQIRDMVFDRDDNLWVSTEEGLYNFFQFNFQNFKFNKGNKDWVWSVLEDDEHNFWFASYQNGLWKWNGTSVTDYTQKLNSALVKHVRKKPVPERYRYYMGASRKGSALYFPTECNILKYENNEFTPVRGLPESPYQMTKIYSDGTFYCSGVLGLYKIEPNKQIRSWDYEDLGVSSVLNFEHDKYGNMLVIGRNGMSVIQEDSIVHYNNENLQYSYSLAKDYKENVWIAGIGNINLFTGDTLHHVATRPEEAFYSLLFVEPHYLFLGGIKGLYIADLGKYYKSGVFETILFNQSNGFTGIECGQNGFITDSEGMVWIPTSDLVTRFDPQKLINKKINPPLIYLNASSSNDIIHWQAEVPGNMEDFRFDRNNFRFVVDAVSFTNSGNIRYYYRLKGLQNEWSEPGENNEIMYYNLQPGTYEFEVKADAGVSIASSEILRSVFTINQPFWKKWWFVLIELLVFAVVVLALVQFFRNREKQKAATQQRLTQLRSEALAAQLDPHFVMNCLNNISGLINAGYKKQANDYIVRFSKLLRVILQSVKKEAISLSSEIEMVTKYMELEQFRCNHCFIFEIKLPATHSPENILVPPMMLQPLVENSIKHGFGNAKVENAKIEIQIKVVDRFLHIFVRDNGKGLNAQSESLGTGLGTKITRERIGLLQKSRNIEFEIQDCNPGAEVHFQIPLVIKHDDFK